MNEHTRTLTHWVGTLIDALVRGGVTDIVVSPGSRSTPLALSAARHPGVDLWMQYDERSAGFFALGLARARGAPVALICTSGTAAANYLPAVVEARLARVPLIVLSADRPHELRDNGAPQTINQIGIYGRHVKWFSDLPEPVDDEALLGYLRSLVARAIAVSQESPDGPVHLNCPFREPLVPDRALLHEIFSESPATVVRGQHGRRTLVASTLDDLVARLRQAHSGLILCGPGCEPGLAAPLSDLAVRLGFPILADPLSGLRCGPHDQRLVISSYDAFLRDERFAAQHTPDLVLRFGAMPTSKPVLQYLQRHPRAYQVVVDGGAEWREPTSLASEHVFADDIWLCTSLLDQVPTNEAFFTPWVLAWLSADQTTRSVVHTHLRNHSTISEPRVFAELSHLLPDGATLFVANSMPVRDCDTFFSASERAIYIAGNRGANGIDGLVSTGLGMAAGGARPLVMVLGDLSLYHDSNGLLAAKLHAIDATIVLINNDGGGIFSFLPQSSEHDQFERLFGTPHGLAFRPLAELYGAHYSFAASWPDFHEAVSAGIAGRGLHIVEVRTNRAQNVADHRALWPLVSEALERAGLT